MRLHALIPIDFAAENVNKQIHGCLSFKVTPQLMRGEMNLEIKKNILVSEFLIKTFLLKPLVA